MKKVVNDVYSAMPFLSGALCYDISPLLQEVEVPAIMAWGAGQFRIKPDSCRRISQINTEIDVFEIANARTAFEIEQPEATLKTLLTFFIN